MAIVVDKDVLLQELSVEARVVSGGTYELKVTVDDVFQVQVP